MRRSSWPGHAAAVWAFLFGILSLYWAAGGSAGLGTISAVMRQRALARHPDFVALLWATVLLKFLAGLLALALCRRWGRSFPRWMLLVAGWGTGVLLALYGGVGLVNAALAELGVFEPTDPGTNRWYLLAWEPIWLVGGVFFIAAAWRYSRDRTSDGRPSSRRAPSDGPPASSSPPGQGPGAAPGAPRTGSSARTASMVSASAADLSAR